MFEDHRRDDSSLTEDLSGQISVAKREAWVHPDDDAPTTASRAGQSTRSESSSALNGGRGGEAGVERSVAADLEGLAAAIRARLPWRALVTNEPVHMDVVEHGLLTSDHVLFPAGTPYVVVAVESWDAADAVRDALEAVARLDEAAWAIDWTRTTRGFREIRIFPDPDGPTRS